MGGPLSWVAFPEGAEDSLASFLFLIVVFAIAAARVSARSGSDGPSLLAIWWETRVVGAALLVAGYFLLMIGVTVLIYTCSSCGSLQAGMPAFMLLFIALPAGVLIAISYLGRRLR
jgi:hypothetical protein